MEIKGLQKRVSEYVVSELLQKVAKNKKYPAELRMCVLVVFRSGSSNPYLYSIAQVIGMLLLYKFAFGNKYIAYLSPVTEEVMEASRSRTFSVIATL